jgi:hypothetical protein
MGLPPLPAPRYAPGEVSAGGRRTPLSTDDQVPTTRSSERPASPQEVPRDGYIGDDDIADTLIDRLEHANRG